MNIHHAINRRIFRWRIGQLLGPGLKYVSIEPVGSRMTCKPAPIGTDQDWLVQVLDKHVYSDVGLAFDYCYRQSRNSDYLDNPSERRFYRKGENNIILTQDALYCRRFRNATRICKELNVLDKAERVTIFKLTCGDVTLVPTKNDY